MTPEQFVALANSVTFKYGRIHAMWPPGSAYVQVRLMAKLEDEGHPGTQIELAMSVDVTTLLIAEMEHDRAVQLLWDRVREFHEHEAQEWFRVGGVKVMDPHAGEAPLGRR